MVFLLQILLVVVFADRSLLVRGSTPCASDDGPVSYACSDIDEAVSFLQTSKLANAGKGHSLADKAASEIAPAEFEAAPQKVIADACCALSHHYDNAFMPYTPEEKAWWSKNDCDTIVGSESGASKCKLATQSWEASGLQELPTASAAILPVTLKEQVVEPPAAVLPVTLQEQESPAAILPVTQKEQIVAPPVSPASKTRMGHSIESCLGALKQSVDDIIGTHLKQAPRPFLLWDPAMYANVGDNLITMAENAMLVPYSPTVCCTASCIATADTRRCPETLEETQKAGWATYVLQGGGNWGDLYAQPQFARIMQLEHLSKCCSKTVIIGMPQSLFYKDEAKEKIEAHRIETAIKEFQTPPVFFWRDRDSLAKASVLYPSAKNILSPEVVWALHPMIPDGTRRDYEYDLLVSARHEESAATASENIDTFKSSVNNISAERPVKVLYSIGWEDLSNKDEEGHWFNRSYFADLQSHRLQAAIEWIRSAPAVVTDKLHMTMLAMLSRLQVVFVDNSYHKLQRTLEVSFALAGQKCSDTHMELLGNQKGEKQEVATIPWIMPATDFESAARGVLTDGHLSDAQKLLEEDHAEWNSANFFEAKKSSNNSNAHSSA